jgi:hypothetical protein
MARIVDIPIKLETVAKENSTSIITSSTTTNPCSENLESLKRKKNKLAKIEKHIHYNVNEVTLVFLNASFFN